MEIVLASHNKKKISEMQVLLSELCGGKIKLLSLDDIGYSGDINEDGGSFEENAAIKAAVPAAMGYIGIADDSGLAVDCLGGAPGIYSARYSGEGATDAKNNEKLLSELDGVADADRGAAFVSVIALAVPGRSEADGYNTGLTDFISQRVGREVCVAAFRGECRGIMLREYRGDGGFGYDPMFFVPEEGLTFAQLAAQRKNEISHRAHSVRMFAEWFNKEFGRIEC